MIKKAHPDLTTTGQEQSVSNPLLVNSLFVLILIYVGRVQEIIPVLDKLYLGKVFIGIVLILLVSNSGIRKIERSIWTYPAGRYLVAVVIISICSIPFSIWISESINFVTTHLVKLVLFSFLLAYGVKIPQDIKRLAWGMAWTGIILSLGAIISPVLEVGRVSTSSTYDSNDIALILAITSPFLYYLMLEAKGPRKLLLLGGIVSIFYVIAMTGSRGGVLSLGTVVLAILLKRGIANAIKLLPVVLVLLFVTFSGSPQLQRYLEMSNLEPDYNMESQGGRVQIWMRTIPLMFQNPLLGTGIGTFVVAEGSTHKSGKWSSPHNAYIQIGVELGLIALMLYLKNIKSMIMQFRSDHTATGNALEVGLYAYCVGTVFLSWAFSYSIFLFIGMSIGLDKMKEIETSSPT